MNNLTKKTAFKNSLPVLFFKKNIVVCVAFVAAAITCFIVPPDKEYLGYFDWKTLASLFCVNAAVCGLMNISFFYKLAKNVIKTAKNARMSILILIYITFISSMFIANDTALLTFLPLAVIMLKTTKKEKYMAFTFIMQNIAANLGGMLTPFGNPKNLYLYEKFSIPTGEFMGIMSVPFFISVGLITLCCIIFVKPEPMEMDNEDTLVDPVKTVVYFMLFVLAIIIVFKVIPYWIGVVIITGILLIMDRKALRMVDYPMLFTFFFFFIFAENMSRIDVIRDGLSMLLDKNTLVVSALSCQVMSSVPASILLSQFTMNYKALLVGVNIGSVGSIISSMASLITVSEYVKHNPGKMGYYIKKFSLFNFTFLGILILIMVFIV